MHTQELPHVPRTPPSVRLVILVYALLVTTNIFDAWATIGALQRGATELNPLMALALSFGIAPFFVIKMTITVVLGAILASTARTQRFAWRGLVGLSAIYFLVFLWHVSLVFLGNMLAITF